MKAANPPGDLFDQYAAAIAKLPPGPIDVWGCEELAMHAWWEREHRMTIAYAPFDHVRPDARVVLVGITPGQQQAEVALRVARDALLAGKPKAKVLAEAKRYASFAGATRTNLVSMLNATDLHRSLDRCA